MSPILSNMRARSRLKDLIREFFSGAGYLDVDTPVVVPCPGAERELRYFPTTWMDGGGESQNLWLRSSPELHMKQLCARGLGALYQLGPCFRSGGEHAAWHHPEFWMLEWYTPQQSQHELRQQTVEFFCHVFENMAPWTHAPLGECTHLTVSECFKEWLNIELYDEDPKLAALLKAAGVQSISAEDDFESAYYKAMLEVIEPRLARLGMVMLSDYLPSQRILSSLSAEGYAQRVEVYIRGVEVSHGCCERVGSMEHGEVFARLAHERSIRGYEVPDVDEFFVQACDDLPTSLCGSACGFDRLLALILGASSLAQIMPFASQIYRSSQAGIRP